MGYAETVWGRRRAFLILGTLFVLCLPLTSAIAEGAKATVTSEEAIRVAQQAVAETEYYEPESIRGFEKDAALRVASGESYWVVDFIGTEGAVRERIVIDSATGAVVEDPAVLRQLDAWDSYLAREGAVGSWTWAIIGVVAAAGAAVGAYFWLRRPRLGWRTWLVDISLGLLVTFYAMGLIISLDIGDTRGWVVCLVSIVLIAGGAVFGLIQRRGRYALVELPEQTAAIPGDASAEEQPVGAVAPGQPSAQRVPAGGPRTGAASGGAFGSELHVIPPENLPDFSDVGGMEDVKTQLRDTVGLLVSHSELVKRYGIDWNGVLLYGPPGVGKTFIAKATAGEYGLNFIDVRVSDLISQFSGASVNLVAGVFSESAKHRPCILFFDEFDSVAQRREDAAWDAESTRVVNQLLRELESAREVPELIVMAATNHKDTLDEAAIRPGRFDRHVAIGLPDEAARRRVFEVQLEGRPVETDVDLDELVRRTDGMSSADISAVVNGAALRAMQRSVADGKIEEGAEEPIGQALLLGSLDELRAKVRPTVEFTSWDDLVLDSATRAKLQDLQEQIEHSDEMIARGIQVPRGILLYGPPGTGKTTIAKVLASQAEASFFAADASEIVSMWLGETEKRIARLFDEARRHRPSIVFIDEIDVLVPARGAESSTENDIASQFLREIDGVGSTPGVFVVGATNIPDALDPALLRGGRLSRQVLIPLPKAPQREELFRVHSRLMPLSDDVDFAALAQRTDALSGADIKEVCSAAGLHAYKRQSELVEMADFLSARKEYRASRRTFTVPDWMQEAWEEPKKKVPLGFVPPSKSDEDEDEAT